MNHENQEREKSECCGCGGHKLHGLVVCWHCFKQHEVIPFKYFEGTLAQWLQVIGRGE